MSIVSESSPPVRPVPLPGSAARGPARLASEETLAALGARFASGAGALDRAGAFPFENLAALHEAGLIAAVVPAAAGGGGATLADARRILAAVAKGEPSTAGIPGLSWLNVWGCSCS
jgi:alkylation response protein AidB-like acyl-CoA dehydrogenase